MMCRWLCSCLFQGGLSVCGGSGCGCRERSSGRAGKTGWDGMGRFALLCLHTVHKYMLVQMYIHTVRRANFTHRVPWARLVRGSGVFGGSLLCWRSLFFISIYVCMGRDAGCKRHYSRGQQMWVQVGDLAKLCKMETRGGWHGVDLCLCKMLGTGASREGRTGLNRTWNIYS